MPCLDRLFEALPQETSSKQKLQFYKDGMFLVQGHHELQRIVSQEVLVDDAVDSNLRKLAWRCSGGMISLPSPAQTQPMMRRMPSSMMLRQSRATS